MKTIETERLLLRPWRAEDADDLYEYARDPAVGPDAGWQPHGSRDVSAQIIQKFIEKDETWAIELTENHKVIGSVGLHNDHRRIDINARMLGYVLSQAYWGRGIMTEAARAAIRHGFEGMGLDLISVCHFTHNQRSRRVIEKCGFRYEGTFRMAWRLYDGVAVDDVSYSLLKEEYEAAKGAWK